MRLLGVSTAVLIGVCALVVGFSAAAPSALPRATSDRPDEVTGEQVHFLYVLPAADAPDEQLDVNGELTGSIARMQAWLAGQTGGPKLRIDTYQGQPDITFVRASLDPNVLFDTPVRETIEQLGFANPKKVYVAYVGALEILACGVAQREGKAAFVWLPCAMSRPSNAAFRLLDSVAMHEILHALGAVPSCAPHGDGGGHVRDRTDLMYPQSQLDESGRETGLLDPGRDDYYGHGRGGSCTDIARSRYLDSNPPSSAPGAPVLHLAPVSRMKAPSGRLMVRARVSNAGPGRVSVQCSARQGRRRLRVLFARYSAGTALCGFAGARRGLVSGKVVVRSGTAVASRTFRLRA